MERLTVKIKNRVGVIWATPPETTVEAALARLAAYEDTGLEPEEVTELVSPKTVEIARLLEKMCEEGSAQHMLELFQAEKDGRLVVLPTVPDVDSASKENLDIFELFLAIKWANAATLMDKNPEVSRLFHLSEIALNEKLERLVNGQSSGPLTREEAEAALKKREEARGE